MVEPWVYILAALLLLTVPLSWICAVIFAAVIHELCHILVIRLCGGSIHKIRVGLGGAVIETGALSNTQELLCALAGPSGSLLLLFLCHHFPRLALAAGIQGIFNLLPVYPLDGGRILRCILRSLFPDKAERVGSWIGGGILLCLLTACIVAGIRLSLGLLPIFLVLLLAGKAISRKRPCKPDGIRVQ